MTMNGKQVGKRQPAKAGFSLTEVMVAGAILAFSCAAVFAACIGAIRTQYAASGYYRASCIARNRIQRGIALPFTTMPMLSEQDRRLDEEGNISYRGTYRRTTTVTQVSDNCYEITVAVLYPAGPGMMSATPVEIRSKVTRGMHDAEMP
jgi:Tfp pilus assembly protein PilV